MKRARKWSADKRAAEGRAAEPGGPLRRRRALRQLDILALDPARELSPSAAHVRVIGGPAVPRVAARNGTEPVPQPGAVGDPAERRVHAVPIGQLLDAPSRSVTTDR